jgi:hypothetical protein
VAVLNLVAGLLNMSVGFTLSWVVWGTAGSVLGVCGSMFFCPIGFLLYFVPFLLLPVALVEILVGIIGLASPESLRSFVRFVPWLQFPCIVLGDIISPIVGFVSMGLLRDAEVAAWIEAR